jgi:hypothetical protein
MGTPGHRPRRRTTAFQVTAQDREILAFMAEHWLVRTDHVQTLLGVSGRAADARLRALTQAGLVSRELVVPEGPACQQITRAGLSVIDSDLSPPAHKVRPYAHDIGMAWVWLAARDGAFGPVRAMVGERRMRSADRPGHRAEPPLAVRLGGVDSRGLERLHYPDLMLVTDRGHRIAVELELTGKDRIRRERIIAAFGADPRIDAVLYLVPTRAVARPIIDTARRLGVSPRIMVQPVRLAEMAQARVQARTAQRRPVQAREAEA